MKRLVFVLGIIGLVFGLVALPVAAQDAAQGGTAEYTTLAQYFPGDTPLYASFRTDEAFVQTLDDLAARIGSVLPGGMMSGSLQELLDQVASAVKPGGTFADTIRPWLGDVAAIGVYTLDDTGYVPPLTIAIRITDQNAAESFFDALPNADRYTLSEGDGYTLYSPDSSVSSDPYYVFRSDVALITGDEALAQSGGVLASSLAQNDALGTALDLLPAPQYNGVMYVDTPAIMTNAMQDRTSATGMNMNAMGAFSSMFDVIQPQAFGFTILNDNALTIDVASPLAQGESDMFNAMMARQPVDLSFAQYIPAGTPLVIHSTDLYDGYKNALDQLQNLAKSLPKNSGMSSNDIDTAVFGLNFVIRGLTGLQADDALGWMTGDYALYLKFSPEFSDSPNLDSAPSSLPVDFGVAFAVTDADAVQNLYDGLSESLSSFAGENATVTHETLGSGDDTLVLTFDNSDMPFPVELLIAKNNDVFVIGTRRMVNAALAPQNGLDNDATFGDASATLLDNPTVVFYLEGNSLQPFARALINSSSSSDQRDGANLKAILGLIHSATISANIEPDQSGSVTRLVWTLPAAQ